jgi:hypothetical protein
MLVNLLAPPVRMGMLAHKALKAPLGQLVTGVVLVSVGTLALSAQRVQMVTDWKSKGTSTLRQR